MERYLSFVRHSLLTVLFLIINFNAGSAQTNVSYTIGTPFPSDHLINVEINVKNYPNSSDGFADLILPAWRSGRYSILNLASGVQEFSAFSSDGTVIPWKKTDKNTWRISGAGLSSFVIKYKVYANELGLRTRSLNSERAYIDASAVLMYVAKMRFDPVEVNVIPYSNWHVTTGLDRIFGKENSFYAKDYDYLADCPMLIGTQTDHEFMIDGKKYVVSFSGEGNYNADTVVNDYKKIIRSITSFWKEIPYDHYTFMLLLSMLNRNATEHINSTAINVNPLMFSNKEAYISFLSTSAHEFFHTWNVKQLRPKGLVPYDFENENYTSELWIAEGLTSYYEDLFLLDGGIIKPEYYLEQLTGKIRSDIERPGNYVQTLADASFDAWVKYNADTQNKRNSESDFYAKGSAVGVLLDLAIRHNSQNKNSLDDVFRDMYKNFSLEKGGYTNDDFIAACEKYNGGSLKVFLIRTFTDWIHLNGINI